MLRLFSRELWGLINMNDSPGLTVHQLESGMATVTRSEDFFDCLPAVQEAFKFSKVISSYEDEQGHAEETEAVQDSSTLNFDEFREFLRVLRQYYVYCQELKIIIYPYL